MLHLMQYAEILLYWLIGGILALLLALPSVKLLAGFIKFSYAKPKVYLANIVFAEFSILIASIVTVTAFILLQRMKNLPRIKASSEKISAFALTVIYGIIFVILMTITAPLKFTLFLISIVAIMVVAFICTPVLMKFVTRILDSSLDRKFEKSFTAKHRALKYAVKNTTTVKMLSNTSRLICIFTTIVITFSVVVISQNEIIVNLKNVFSAEYAILNATERCHEKLEECQSVESTYEVYVGSATQSDGTPIHAFASPDISVFSDKMQLTCQPEGDGVIISEGQAKMLGVGIGDRIDVNINDTVITLTVIETVRASFAIVIFDAEYYGIPYNMLMAKGANGTKASEVILEISDKTAAELATVSLTSDLLEARVDIIEMYLRAAKVLLAIIVLFVCIGFVNNLCDSYRARKPEFALFELSGMSRKEIKRMKICEISVVLAIGIVFSIIVSIFSVFSADAGLSTFGHQTIINVFKSFGFI